MMSHTQQQHWERRGRAIVDLANERGRTFGDTSDDWINDPDRMARCDSAAEYGCDGSTHAEVIEDQRENVRQLVGNNRPRMLACAMEYLSHVESWHEQNGSLDQEIG